MFWSCGSAFSAQIQSKKSQLMSNSILFSLWYDLCRVKSFFPPLYFLFNYYSVYLFKPLNPLALRRSNTKSRRRLYDRRPQHPIPIFLGSS